MRPGRMPGGFNINEMMKQAQIDTEEMYISHCEIIPFKEK